MPLQDIPGRRLANQQITGSTFSDAAGLVAWLGAVQAQDYSGAQWALGLRLPGNTQLSIQQAYDQGQILRTHVMRPTWHFVHPADIRWLLALTAARVHAFNASYYRKMELDAPIFTRANTTLEKTLRGGKHLTRPELAQALQRAGIATDDLRLTLLIMHAELDGLLCSGPRNGKQFSYALLDERVPAAPGLDRDAALAELAGRYFSSHGPASLQDFSWWSGLAAATASSGLDLVKARLEQAAGPDGKTYWFDPSLPIPQTSPDQAFLLPNFDEYTVGYTDRSAVFDARQKLGGRGDLLSSHTLVIGGRVAGTWRRTLKQQAVMLEMQLFDSLDAQTAQNVRHAAERYGEFLGLPILPGPL